MQTELRNGKFVVSVSDNVRTGCRFRIPKSELEEEVEVEIRVVEGGRATLEDLIDLIAHELFDSYYGLKILAKQLKCHVIGEKTEYDFTVNYQTVHDLYYHEIARQLKL